MKARQRGASLLIPVLLLITVGAFAVIVAGTQSGSDIQGSQANADSIEALFVAETGIERAIRRFMAGSACSAAGLSENITDLSTIGIASGRTIIISAGPNSGTDFNAVALPATQCRIQVSALVGGNNVSRTLQAVMDRADNFVVGPLIASFNDPAGNVAPVSWTGGAYDYAGGYLAGAPVQPNCTRSGYALKAVSGAGTATATSQGSASVAFSVARPSTILASFDYRIIQVGSGSLGCTTNAGTGTSCVATNPTLDATSPSGAGNGQICMALRDTAGANWGSTRYEALSAFNASGL